MLTQFIINILLMVSPIVPNGKEVKEIKTYVVQEPRGYKPGPLGFPPNIRFPVSN